MQKKIIALAVAGLVSGAAFAQSNVQIYGIVDAAYLHSKANGTGSSNQIASGVLSGSRIGFQGTEDLGGGLKAVFNLEYSLANDLSLASGGAAAGGAIGNARQQYVGLAGNWGTFIAGGLQTPAFGLTAKYDALVGSALSPVRTLSDASIAAGQAPGTGAFNLNTINASSRVSNAVAYVSPNFSGFTATAAYAFGGVSGDNVNTKTNDQERTYAFTLEYTNGPLGIAGIYHNTDNIGNPLDAAANADATEWAILASYDFGIAKLMGGYNRSNFDAGAGANTENDKVWNIGVVVPVGAGNVHFAYARATDDSALKSDDSSAWSVAYTHSLSKRTTAYAGYTRVSNERNSNLGTIAGVGAPVAGKNASTYGVGLRHSF